MTLLDLDRDLGNKVLEVFFFADGPSSSENWSSIDLVGNLQNDNSLRLFGFALADVTGLDFTITDIITDIDAVATLDVTPVPVAASLPMLIGAAGGPAWLRPRPRAA